jgi:hypothetical protein
VILPRLISNGGNLAGAGTPQTSIGVGAVTHLDADGGEPLVYFRGGYVRLARG